MGSIPGSGRSPGEGNGNPLQYPCLGNPMDRGAWQAAVHGAAKSRTRLSRQALLSHYCLWSPYFLTSTIPRFPWLHFISFRTLRYFTAGLNSLKHHKSLISCSSCILVNSSSLNEQFRSAHLLPHEKWKNKFGWDWTIFLISSKIVLKFSRLVFVSFKLLPLTQIFFFPCRLMFKFGLVVKTIFWFNHLFELYCWYNLVQSLNIDPCI